MEAWSRTPTGAIPAFGTIVEAGEGVPDRETLIGQHALVPAFWTCGGCVPCRRGQPAFCEHREPVPDSAEKLTVGSRLVVPMRRHGEAAQLGALVAPADARRMAALVDVGLRAYAAVIRASVEPNRAAVVVGGGPLAHFVAALVEHRGAVAIRVDDRSALEAALQHIRAALAARDLAWFALPVIAATPCRSNALRLAAPGSTVVLCETAETVGSPSDDAACIVEQGLTVHGLRSAHPDLLPELAAFACKGTLDLAPLVEEKPFGDRTDTAERIAVWVRAA